MLGKTRTICTLAFLMLVAAAPAVAQMSAVVGTPLDPPNVPPMPVGTYTLEEGVPFEFQATKIALNLSDEEYTALIPKLITIERVEIGLKFYPAGQYPKDSDGKAIISKGLATSLGPKNVVFLAMVDLQKTIDGQAPPDVLRGKLEAVRAARQNVMSDYQSAITDFMKLLKKRQEATVVGMNLQGWLYHRRFGDKSFIPGMGKNEYYWQSVFDQMGLKDEESKALMAEKFCKLGVDVYAVDYIPPKVMVYHLPGVKVPVPNDPLHPPASDPNVKNVTDAYDDLVKVLKDKESSTKDVSTKLDAFYQARADVEADLQATEKALRSTLTLRQEAILVTNGILE